MISTRTILKTGSAHALRAMFNALPRALRNHALDVLIDCVDDRKRAVVLTRLASALNVRRLVAGGEMGEITSQGGDSAVFVDYLLSGTWARRTNHALLQFFSGRDGIYIDVGANIGLTTIPIARNTSVRCLAFEPEPNNFGNLQRNVANNCPGANVTLFQCALFDRNTSLDLELSEGNLGDHRLKLNHDLNGSLGEHRRSSISIRAERLDDLVSEWQGDLAAKIDAQGAEPFIVSGGAKVLARAGLLILEFWPYGINRLGGSVDFLIDFLRTNFRSALVHEGDCDRDAQIRDVQSACGDLQRAAANYRNSPAFYLDVFAWK
jgi:FkbM family methyltransferase